jgi:hypothetical protein
MPAEYRATQIRRAVQDQIATRFLWFNAILVGSNYTRICDTVLVL